MHVCTGVFSSQSTKQAADFARPVIGGFIMGHYYSVFDVDAASNSIPHEERH